MKSGFAIVDCVKSLDDIEFKHEIVKKLPKFLFDYAVKKYNPFSVVEMEMCEHQGVFLTLNIRGDDALGVTIAESGAKWLAENGVCAVYFRGEYCAEIRQPFVQHFNICDGKTMFAMLIDKAINKTLELTNRDLKTCNVLLIGEPNDLLFTLISVVYQHVNDLSLICENVTDNRLLNFQDYIYEDCGLVFNLGVKNRNLLENADVIINLNEDEQNFEYSFKRNATYFELSTNVEKAKSLKIKRTDMHVYNDLSILCCDETFDLSLFETICLAKNRNLKSLINRGFKLELVDDVMAEIEDMTPVVDRFKLNT